MFPLWRLIQMYEFLMKGLLSLLELPDSDDTVLLLLCDVDSVDVLVSDPGLDPPDLLAPPVFEERPDLAELPDSDVLSDLEEMSDTSEMSNLEDSSEMEDTLVLEVILDAVDRAVVDLFFSGSGSCLIVIILEMERRKKMIQQESYFNSFTKLYSVEMFPIFLSCCCFYFFCLCIDSPFFSSTEGRTHRPQVEKPTCSVKGRAHPAEEQRGAEVKPAGVPAATKFVSKSFFFQVQI